VNLESLRIVLEFAYAGDKHLGRDCRNTRVDGCPACAAFTDAEEMAYGEAATSEMRNWFEGGED
jgi:hypothetical protein